MKKIRPLPLALYLILALAAPARAQVTVGVLGGLNRSDLSGDAPDDIAYAGKSAFGFGLVGEFHLTGDVWLSVQPTYLGRGTKITEEIDEELDPVERFDFKLDYIAVPVLAKFVTAGGKVYVTSGVNISFLSSAKLKPADDGAEVDIKDALRGVDLAVDFGVGAQLPIGRPRIMLEARYEQGLSNIADPEDPELQALRTRLRSSGLQLLAGILLPLGGGR